MKVKVDVGACLRHGQQVQTCRKRDSERMDGMRDLRRGYAADEVCLGVCPASKAEYEVKICSSFAK